MFSRGSDSLRRSSLPHGFPVFKLRRLSPFRPRAANAAYKLFWRLAGAEAIGPILLGMKGPVHALQRGVEAAGIVNMVAIAIVDAQEKGERAQAALPIE